MSSVPSSPAPIAGSAEFYSNYTNVLEVKNYTDGTLTISDGYIHNLNDPILAKDAANKQYVLDNATGDSGALKTWKNAVQVASTVNIPNLSGTLTVDGVNLGIDDRVLVKNQNVLSDNGIYLVASGAWSRTLDATTDTPVQASGSAIYIMSGMVNANKVYTCNTVDVGPTYNPVLYGTDITFIPFGQSTPGGGNTQVQFNNAGILDGSANLVWDGVRLSSVALKTNSIEPLTTSDVNLYTTQEAPIIIGNVVSPTVAISEQTGSGIFTLANQSGNIMSLIGSNRVTGTGASLALVTGSGSLGGSMYMLTGSSSVGAGPPIILRPGSGSTTQGNVIVNPVIVSESISTTTGSLVVQGGLGVTGSITSGGTITGTQLLANGKILVGSANGVATPTVMSGDASIVNSGVVTLVNVIAPATYSSANITVDSKGRVIAASNGSGTAPGGSSGAIQYNNAGTFGGLANFTTPAGSDIVGGTSAQLYIGNTSSLVGSLGPLSVAGSAYIARSLIVGETLGANIPLPNAQMFVGSATNIATRATMSGDASLTNTGVLNLNSVVTAGTFTNTNMTIDSKGRVIAAVSGSSGTPGGTSGALQYNNGGLLGGTSLWSYGTTNPYTGGSSNTLISTGSSSLYVGGNGGVSITGPLVVNGTTQFTSLTAMNNASVSGSLVVNGTITGNQILPSASLLVGSAAGYAVAQTVTGDTTISNTGVTTLASVTTAGTFSNANITVDAKGRVVTAVSGSSGTPGGVSGAIQYNNGGILGGTSQWFYNTASGSIYSTGNSSLYIGGTGTALNNPSIFTGGGAFISKSVYIGPDVNNLSLYVNGNTQLVGTLTSYDSNDITASNPAIMTSGGVHISKSLLVDGTITGNQILPSGALFVGSSVGYATAQTMSGDASLSNVGALTLSSVGAVGTFTNANISVDAKGRVVVASSGGSSGASGTSGSLQYNNGGVLGGTGSWFFGSTDPYNGIVSNTLYSTGNSSMYIGGTAPAGNGGSFTTLGGTSISKDLIVGGSDALITGQDTVSFTVAQGYSQMAGGLNIQGTNDVGASHPGLLVGGGATIGKSMYVNGTNDTTSTLSGAVKVLGGVGIVKSLTVGGTITGNLLTAQSLNITGTAPVGSSASIVTAGGVIIAKDLDVAGQALFETNVQINNSLTTIGSVVLASSQGSSASIGNSSGSTSIYGTSVNISSGPYSIPLTYLVVGSGGPGVSYGGGGGGGGVISSAQMLSISSATQTLNITVAAGGSGYNSVLSGTSLTTVTAIAGGYGGSGYAGGSGGSGGGGGSGAYAGGSGTAGQGNNGGASVTSQDGGGGGGAGGVGSAGVGAAGGAGGAGISNSITGSAVLYGGGGGGGGFTSGGAAGSGGGGAGSNFNGGNATANTGGGGGGGFGGSPGNGGSGIVILSLPTAYYVAGNITGGVIVTDYTVATNGTSTVISFKTPGSYVYTIGGVNGVTIPNNLTVYGTVTSMGAMTAPSFNATSDSRLKDNIRSLVEDDGSATERISNVCCYKYNFKNNTQENYGFIAQQLLDVGLQDLVITNSDNFYSVNYNGMIPLLVESIKELNKKIEELNSKILEFKQFE